MIRFRLHPRLSRLLLLLEGDYRRLFSIAEIETQPILQWMFGASLLFFYAVFSLWIGSSAITVETAQSGRAVCWPYFQSCADYFFLHMLPYGYSQTMFYMALYGLMALVIWCMWRRRWSSAHALMLVMLLWEIVWVFLFAYAHAAPYYYYHIALTAALLFAAHKEFFLKLTFVFLYFMSATIKFDDAWVLGTYFTSLKHGLPIFPDVLTPLFTNLVIFMQVIGCWFLLARNALLQRTALTFFVAFHLYSGVFVTYFYPTVALPPLLVLFGPLYRHTPIPFTMKTLAGWLLIALLAIFQLLGFSVPTDRRLTLEGNRFGMFMFEANHQCVATMTTYATDEKSQSVENWELPAGTPCSGFYCRTKASTKMSKSGPVKEERFESATAWNRCDPYEWWSRLQVLCTKSGIERISLKFDHSINGGPFYRIVDEANMCETTYAFLKHNDWIKVPPESPIVGYPVTNSYHY